MVTVCGSIDKTITTLNYSILLRNSCFQLSADMSFKATVFMCLLKYTTNQSVYTFFYNTMHAIISCFKNVILAESFALPAR